MTDINKEINTLPEPYESKPDENGIITITEYVREGSKIFKITKKIKRTRIVRTVRRCVADRRQWKKFGRCIESKDGYSGFNYIKEGTTYRSQEVIKIEPIVDDTATVEVEASNNKWVSTSRNKGNTDILHSEHQKKSEPIKTDKYVPKHRRGNNNQENLDDPKLRINNLSEDTNVYDIKDLLRKYNVKNVHMPKDRVTGDSRGFAFAYFSYKDDAQKALNELQGFRLNHMIIHLEWTN